MSRLIHYTPKPLTVVTSTPQNSFYGTDTKPNGFWVSVEGEDDWISWCRGEDWGESRFVLAYEIVLKEDANILRIVSASGLDEFTKKYRAKDNPILPRLTGIDWEQLSMEYQGIIIAPYQWSRRLSEHTFWYYGWDCASGCIWDADAIQEVKELEPPVFRQKEN